MGTESDEIGGLLLTAFNVYIRPRKLGRAYSSTTGFRCFPHQPEMVRLPDTSHVASGKLPDERSPEGFITVAPDIAVGVVSPHNLYEAWK